MLFLKLYVKKKEKMTKNTYIIIGKLNGVFGRVMSLFAMRYATKKMMEKTIPNIARPSFMGIKRANKKIPNRLKFSKIPLKFGFFNDKIIKTTLEMEIEKTFTRSMEFIVD